MENQNIFEKFQPKDKSNLTALLQEVYDYAGENSQST